jgi:hypothetical protein
MPLGSAGRDQAPSNEGYPVPSQGPNGPSGRRGTALRYAERGAKPTPTESAADVTTNGPLQQVRLLGELRDSGCVTTAEFEAKKAELLGRV